MKHTCLIILTFGLEMTAFGQAFTRSPLFAGAAAIQGVYSGPTWVTNGNVTSGTGAITPAVPAGYAANDIFLLFVESANDRVSQATPTDWQVVTNTSGNTNGWGAAAGTSSVELEVFWRRSTASESAPSVADRGNHTCGIIMCIRGAETNGYPFNFALAGIKSGTNTTVSITGGTSTVHNVLVVSAVTDAQDDASTTRNDGWANADLESVTERIDTGTVSGNGGGIGVALGYKRVAGAIGNTTATGAFSTPNAFWIIGVKKIQ
jgi:hypothetical protein